MSYFSSLAKQWLEPYEFFLRRVPLPRGLELTNQGRLIYQQAKELLRLVNGLGSAQAPTTKLLRIGLPEVLALAISGEIIKALKTDVTIDEMDTGEIEAQIIKGNLDFGCTFVPFPHRAVDHLRLGKISFATFAQKGSFAGVPANQIPYVIPSIEIKDNPLSIKVRDGWDPKKERRTPYRSNSLAVALSMVRSGTCGIFAPRLLITQLNRTSLSDQHLVEIAGSQKAADRTVFLTKRGGDEENSEMKKVARLMRQLMAH